MYYPTRQEFLKLTKKGNLIPVYRELLADMETPVSAFLKIDKGDYSFLLESVEGQEKIARFSFLASSPSLIFKSKNNSAEIMTPKNKINLVSPSPLGEIKKMLDRFKLVPVEGLPRFFGGFVGYIGYDTVRFFEKIPAPKKDDLRLPDCFFMLADTIVIFDHVNHKIKVVANAHLVNTSNQKPVTRNQIIRVYDEAVGKIEDIVKKLSQPIRISKPQTANRKPLTAAKISSNFSKEKFEEAVRKAKEYIRRGDIIQAVLSQRFVARIKSSAFDIYRALRALNPSPYMYYLKFKGVSIVGASPEVFVRCEDGKVELRPIAGTRRRGRDEKEDKALEEELLKDEKERAEHIMLVDLGRNDLGRVCEYGSVRLPEQMIIERYSHVMHIVSDLVGELRKDKDNFDVIKATFPAGTVTGAPKIRAMEIIQELEDISRGPYAGCVVYFGFSGNLDSCITIRTIVIKDGYAYIQAGAGIVADSQPALEYQETVNKAKAMLRAIEIAEQGMA
jgi:anthranilate synthase component 1